MLLLVVVIAQRHSDGRKYQVRGGIISPAHPFLSLSLFLPLSYTSLDANLPEARLRSNSDANVCVCDLLHGGGW